MSGERDAGTQVRLSSVVVSDAHRRNGATHTGQVPVAADTQQPSWKPTSVLEQIELLRSVGQRRGFGFTEADFRRLPKEEPWWPANPRVVHVVVPYFDTVDQTARELYAWIKVTFARRVSKPKDLTFEPQKPYLRSGVKHPGHMIRIETINLASVRNRKRGSVPNDVRDSRLLPHAGILAAMVMHQAWPLAWDGKWEPFPWIAGYGIFRLGQEQVLYADRVSGGIRFSTALPDDQDRQPGYAVPTFDTIPT